MKVVIACEFSGIVRDAFISKGHDAISVDLLPTEQPGNHAQQDIFDFLDCCAMCDTTFDMLIAFPPCTYLCVSGARWFKDRQREQQEALEFIRKLMNQPIDKICVENPIGVISTKIRKPDQIIQPWQFGHVIKEGGEDGG